MSHDDMVTRIIGYYHRATPAQRVQGRAWYRRTAAMMAGYSRHGWTAQQAAEVFASYSVNTAWSLNIRYASRHLRGNVPSTLGQNVRRSQAILDGTGTLDTLVKDAKKLKIRNFARNLAGCTSSVTVDRWAMLVATGEKRVPEGAEYEAVAAAYREAARMVGETPADVQAITWVLVRE